MEGIEDLLREDDEAAPVVTSPTPKPAEPLKTETPAPPATPPAPPAAPPVAPAPPTPAPLRLSPRLQLLLKPVTLFKEEKLVLPRCPTPEPPAPTPNSSVRVGGKAKGFVAKLVSQYKSQRTVACRTSPRSICRKWLLVA